jgi:hypothetical protein
MDVTEYRSRYEAELERAAREKVSFRDLLESSQGGHSETEDDLTAAIAVIRDNHPDAQLRAAALRLISLDIDENPELIGSLLDLLRDGTMPTEARLAVLNLLQQISFRMASFPAIRPDYLATLRSIIADPDAGLRQQVISILAQEKDEYVQRRLIEGLEGRSAPLVPAAMAIQGLGHDLHAEHFSLLRRIIEDPPSRAAKEAAVRLLAADPDITDLLFSILQDRGEDPEMRRLSAVALQTAVPDRFAEQARRIVFDDDEEEELRVVAIVALTYFASPVGADDELIERIERLGTESASRELRQVVASFLSRHGG